MYLPRFIRGPFARFLQPRLRRPHLRVHLDEIGSFIWQRCDGQTTVAELAAAMEAHFGEAIAPVMPRLQLFMNQLQQSQLIQVQPPARGGGLASQPRRPAAAGPAPLWLR